LGRVKIAAPADAAPTATPAPAYAPAGAANLDNRVRLLGYDLPAGPLHPGQAAPLTLYWQVLAPVGDDYQVFVHLAAADETLAREVATLAAGIGDPADPESGSVYAAIAAEASARAAADSALAQQSTTVQTQVGQNLASIQQLMSSVDGIKAKWAVRLDVNGRVAGLELIGTGDRASMVFLVDTFMVGKPGASGAADFPFVIGTVNGVTKVSISNAFIQDAAIGSAKIKDLTIGRIKLASGVDAGLSWGYSNYSSTQQNYPGGTGGWITPAGGDISLPTESRGRTLVNGFIRCAHWYGSVEAALFVNGVLVQHMGGSGGGSYDPANSLLAYYVDRTPINGTSTYEIRLRGTGESVTKFQCGISAITFYR
jgi:hypothetical protein